MIGIGYMECCIPSELATRRIGYNSLKIVQCEH